MPPLLALATSDNATPLETVQYRSVCRVFLLLDERYRQGILTKGEGSVQCPPCTRSGRVLFIPNLYFSFFYKTTYFNEEPSPSVRVP